MIKRYLIWAICAVMTISIILVIIIAGSDDNRQGEIKANLKNTDFQGVSLEETNSNNTNFQDKNFQITDMQENKFEGNSGENTTSTDNYNKFKSEITDKSGNDDKNKFYNSNADNDSKTVENGNQTLNTASGGNGQLIQNDINNVIKTAEGFRSLSCTVNYKTIESGYRKSFLYYFSSSVNAEESVDAWIKEVKDNKIISEAKFEADKSSVYIDDNNYTRVKGVFYVKYSTETDKDYLTKKGITADKWYRCEEELLFYIAVDDYKWARGEWVFYRGFTLTGLEELNG